MRSFVFFVLSFLLSSCQSPAASDGGLARGVGQVLRGVAVEPATKQSVIDLAVSSDCARAYFADRGRPPRAFIAGIALSYANSVCHPDEASELARRPVGDADRDALAHYGLNPRTSEERLSVVYSLLVGSAARESSWRWCVGKDASASNDSAETAEAGLYQTSFNSRRASPVLERLYASFKADKSSCYDAVYKNGIECSTWNLKNWGTGEGVEFQRLTKHCPGFASEYHAVMVRVNRRHYGPINRRKSEIKPVCTAMFENIRRAIESDPAICGSI